MTISSMKTILFSPEEINENKENQREAEVFLEREVGVLRRPRSMAARSLGRASRRSEWEDPKTSSCPSFYARVLHP